VKGRAKVFYLQICLTINSRFAETENSFRNFLYYLNDYEELVAAKKFIQFLIRVITLRALTRTSLAEPFFLNHLK